MTHPTIELSILLPGQDPRKVPLTGSYTIGRDASSDLVLKDARVSRGHALLRPLGGGAYFLLDLGSANGTFLNGRLVTAPVQLADGDTIVIADCTMRFEARNGRPDAEAAAGDDWSASTKVNLSTEAVSILVVELLDFAALSKAVPPMELPSFIGGWFRDASAAIESRDGVIDRFAGGSIVAYWPGGRAPAGLKLARGPLEVALELVDAARAHNRRLVARHPEARFALGCGVHLGEAMFGGVSSYARREFTAISGCVDTAVLLGGRCQSLERAILASPEVKDAAEGAYAFEDMERAFSVTRKKA